MRKALAVTLALSLTACVASLQQPAALGSIRSLILARQAGMHMATTLMVKNIRRAVSAGTDVRDQDAAADGIAMWAEAIPGLFPPGSTASDSRALPDIWKNKADFDRRAADLHEAAQRLSQIAASGDKAAFAAQVDVVQSRCAACHERYRAPQS
jgi:cytochrome c556